MPNISEIREQIDIIEDQLETLRKTVAEDNEPAHDAVDDIEHAVNEALHVLTDIESDLDDEVDELRRSAEFIEEVLS